MPQSPMTTREPMTRMYEHRQAGRVPIIDSPWGSTIARWEWEGMPTGADHSIPDNVSLDQYREFVTLAKALGSYD